MGEACSSIPVKSVGVRVGSWVGCEEGNEGFKVVCWSDGQGDWICEILPSNVAA